MRPSNEATGAACPASGPQDPAFVAQPDGGRDCGHQTHATTTAENAWRSPAGAVISADARDYGRGVRRKDGAIGPVHRARPAVAARGSPWLNWVRLGRT